MEFKRICLLLTTPETICVVLFSFDLFCIIELGRVSVLWNLSLNFIFTSARKLSKVFLWHLLQSYLPSAPRGFGIWLCLLDLSDSSAPLNNKSWLNGITEVSHKTLQDLSDVDLRVLVFNAFDLFWNWTKDLLCDAEPCLLQLVYLW